MSNKKYVTTGEASESESESDEIMYDGVESSTKKETDMPPSTSTIVHATDGEATESLAEESYRRCNSNVQQNQFSNLSDKPQAKFRKRTSIGDSFLQKKLCESNATLWKDLMSTTQNIALSAAKQLHNTDKLLLKSQVVLQSTAYSLKDSSIKSKEIQEKIQNIVTANFIPSIKF